ncbi:Stp1/IreP family PP2C-type Ser/Thr phosphatase [Bacillaceae bacterium Marseille-Q3522]|nr:Stp1/IreP family PP2C-type Ser/Thr phosphatase [Bacillaceae bacterium Marseille-Q3522]
MKAVFKTDLGRIRQRNEDNGGIFANGSNQRLAIVADGVGGHLAGDVASEMAIMNLKERWEKAEKIQTAEQAENWLLENINEVNSLLFEHAQNHPECNGMGTTIVAVISTEQFLTTANIGDSRCYLWNEEGFKQLTEDHSLVNELVRSGLISKEDAEHHPRKNIVLRALGTERQVEIDVKTIMFEEGDVLLLCSDGLSDKVTEKDMVKILQKDIPLQEKAEQLIRCANDLGGEDNITIIILEFLSKEESGENS